MNRRFTKITILLAGSLFWAACGGLGSGGPGTLTLKYPGTEKQEMPVKSGGFYTSTKSWSKSGQVSKSASYFICVADHEIDMSRGAISIGGPVKSEGETKVCFSIDGEENTDDKTPLKTGTYGPAKRGEGFAFTSVSSASIRTFKDGKEVKKFLNESKSTGEVKITSASGDSISGEINLNDGENEIKGNFSAKAFKSK
ncbi:MAG: hypothetical protein R2747_06905 [Pyrinomonadaceae bacterium]